MNEVILMKTYDCGYGHALVDNNSIVFTSPDAVDNCLETIREHRQYKEELYKQGKLKEDK